MEVSPLQEHKGKVFLGFLIGAFFLWLSIKDIDWEVTKTDFSKVTFRYIFGIIFATAAFFWIKAFRWTYILNPIKHLKTSSLFPPMMAGVFLNFFVSILVGEFVRSFLLGKRFGLSKTAILASIFLERVYDVLTLLVLLALTIAFTSSTFPMDQLILYFTVMFLIAFALISLVVWKDPTIHWLGRITEGFSAEFRSKWHARLDKGVEGLRSLTEPKLVFPILIISVIQWTFICLAKWFAMVAIGLDVPFSAGILVTVLIAFALILPQSPAQIGVIEFGFVYGLKLFGISASDALASALIYHLLYIVAMCFVIAPTFKKWISKEYV